MDHMNDIVRVAIGQTGGGPATDAANEIIAAVPSTPPAPTPTPTPKAFGPGDASVAGDLWWGSNWRPSRRSLSATGKRVMVGSGDALARPFMPAT